MRRIGTSVLNFLWRSFTANYGVILILFLVWLLFGPRIARESALGLDLERAKGIEPSYCAAPRRRTLSRRGTDGCKQPKTKAYMCENMCDFFLSRRSL